MRDLIILGTGVHGAEMAEIVARVNAVTPTWNFLGHITSKAFKAGDLLNGNPVLGALEVLDRYSQAVFVPDNEFPRDKITLPRERLVSLIDPTVFVSKSSRIGVGCVFYPHCYLGLKAKVGDFVFALAGTIINHDDVIEDRVVLASGVTLAGFVHVEPECYLGQSCTIRQSLRVGRKSLIGMGAVVTKNVEPYTVMVGNPARKLRDNR